MPMLHRSRKPLCLVPFTRDCAIYFAKRVANYRKVKSVVFGFEEVGLRPNQVQLSLGVNLPRVMVYCNVKIEDVLPVLN